jgi:hypothetical protein
VRPCPSSVDRDLIGRDDGTRTVSRGGRKNIFAREKNDVSARAHPVGLSAEGCGVDLPEIGTNVMQPSFADERRDERRRILK